MNTIETISSYLSNILFGKKEPKSGFVPTTDLDKKIMPNLSGLPEVYQEAIKKSGTISSPTGKSIDLKTANPIQYANIKAQESKDSQQKLVELGKTILRAPGRALASFAIEGEKKAPDTLSRQILFGDQPIERGFTPQTPLQKFIFGEEEVVKPSIAYQETQKAIEPTFGKASMPLAGTAVFGSLLLDLTPFGGSEKKLAETLAKEGSESVIRNLMKEANFTDDLIEKYASIFAKENDVMKINQTIKTFKPLPQAQKAIDVALDNEKGIFPDTGLKERQFTKTVQEAPVTKTEIKKGLDELDNYYIPQGNKELVQEADDLIKNNIDEAIKIVKSPGGATAKSNIIGQKLIIEYQSAGRYEDAIDIVENLSKKATNQGQAIQALSIFNKLTPEGVLRYTQKILDKANTVRRTPLKLNPKKAEEIIEQATKVSKLPEGRKKVVETARLLEKVLEQVPPSLGTKIATLQTMAQLLNPKTFIRNIVGNLGFGIAENVKDIIATPLDSALSLITKKRTTGLPSIRTQIGGFTKGLAEGVEDALQRVNTSMVNTQFDLPKTRVFKGRVGQSLEKLLNLELRATDRAFYQSAYDGSLYQQLKSTGLKEATEEIKEIAHFDALYKTFQDDNIVSKLFVGIKKALNSIGTKEFGMGDFILKYPKTPANLLARGIEYSPGGFVNTLYEAVRPVLGKPFNQKKFVDSFSRAMLGSGALIGSGALLHRLGIITGKPEKDTDIKGIQRISGLGQYRINFSALKRFLFSGLNPETAKLEPGDMLVSYDWFQPMAIPLSMGANIDEGGGAKGQVMSAVQSMTEGINTLGEQPLVSGIRRLALTKDWASTLEESLKGIPSSFIPTFLSQINQLIDNTQRNSYDPSTYQYALNLAKAKIPGLAQTLPPSIDVFGENLERYQGDSNNIFNVFFNPAFTSWYKPTPEAQMVLDIMDITGETKHSPRVVGKTYTINGESKKLNPKQITAMQRYVGTITKELFASFSADNKFQALPPDEKIKYLSNVLSDVGSAGKIVILGDRPKKPSKDVLNIIKIFNGQIK